MNGTEFGRYRLVELLGRGGMGEVWRAFDTVTERVVALKVLPTQYADDATYQERFRREARSAAALDEPHVVPIYDFGEINGRLFVTMRLITGRDLHAMLREGPLDPSRAVTIIDQVASALHAAHQVNLVHRDVKPSNILVTEDDFTYLIDFGIARVMGQTSMTATGGVIGTWAYMAPERLSGGQTDPRADIYALACVLYESLTGRQPFGGDSLEQQIGGHLTLPPPRASEHRANVPAPLDAVIARGMAKNPDDRYATTREFARAARAALGAPATGPNTLSPNVGAPFMHQPTPFDRPPGRPMPPPVGPPPAGPRPGGPPPGAPPQYWAPAPQQIPHHRPPSRKGRIIALSSIGAAATILAVVAAIALSGSDDNGSSRAGPTTTTSSELPNSGPFTGTFSVALGPKFGSDGSAITADTDSAAFTETWRLRSACGSNGCVATALKGGSYPSKDLVFDQVGGRWLAVAVSRRSCDNRNDAEAWNTFVLEPQADGSLKGEWSDNTSNQCFRKRTLVLTRTGDTNVSSLPDPKTLPARRTSPAEALHGRYDSQVKYAGNSPSTSHFGVRTDCLRTGDRCMSFFLDPASGGQTFIFANGAWTRNEEWTNTCPSGGKMHTTQTVTLSLPEPLQDPIMSLAGHGYADNAPGTKCASQPFDQTITRTGD